MNFSFLTRPSETVGADDDMLLRNDSICTRDSSTMIFTFSFVSLYVSMLSQGSRWDSTALSEQQNAPQGTRLKQSPGSGEGSELRGLRNEPGIGARRSHSEVIGSRPKHAGRLEGKLGASSSKLGASSSKLVR